MRGTSRHTYQVLTKRAARLANLRDQCRRSGTAFFFKQWGGRLLDDRTWDEMPRPRKLATSGL